MRSKANYRSHPIHPVLVPFPLAFLIGAFGFDVLGVVTANEAWWRTGGYLALIGIATALIAAVPGFIDYFYTVPPNSTGKQRATRHLLVNLSAVALFASAAVLRGGPAREPAIALLLIELIAVGLLAAGGWMGGVLVGRNMISIDHRYAGAGKWQEKTVSARAGESFEAARADELAVDQMKLLRTSAGRVVLARTETGWVAFDDHCTHRGGSLAGGAMICGTVQCPWHGSQFDAATGAVRAGPAQEAIRTYAVEERDGIVHVTL
jgi:uncharacterized membrane protein/nitrite reductase/ring-hydroxylating ferredoxin subunit